MPDSIPESDQTFGQMLKAARKRQKLTQDDLAKAVKLRGGQVTQGYISLVERSAGTPNEPIVGRELVEYFAAVLFLDRKIALKAAGHNPDSPIHRNDLTAQEGLNIRIMVEFEAVGANGTRRALSPDDLTPGMRRHLARLLLDGDSSNATSE